MIFIHCLAYLSVLVFIITVVGRYLRFATTPVHLRWELYPVAHEGKRSVYGGSYLEEGEWWKKPLEKHRLGELRVMLPEIILLKGIYEHNRKLWYWSFLMHHGVYWLAGSVALFLIDGLMTVVGFTLSPVRLIIDKILPAIMIIGYTTGLIGTAGLIILRRFDYKLKIFNSFATYFNLMFLLVNFASGFISLLGNPHHISDLKHFFAGLMVFNQINISDLVYIHLLLGILFLIYLPFTHMTHFFTKWFTYHSVRWGDESNLPGGKIEREVRKYLQYPVEWSAKHIGADGKKSWAEIATLEVPKDVK